MRLSYSNAWSGFWTHTYEPSGLVFLAVVLAIAITPIISLVALVSIIRRAGFSGWWVLLLFLPGVNLLAFWYFGFAPWPALARGKAG